MEVRGRPGHGMEVRHHPPDDLANKAADEARMIPGGAEPAGGGEPIGRPASRSEKTRLPGSPPPTEIVSTEPPSTLAQVRARLSEVNSQPGLAEQAAEAASGSPNPDDDASSRRGLILGGGDLAPSSSTTVDEIVQGQRTADSLLEQANRIDAPPPALRANAQIGFIDQDKIEETVSRTWKGLEEGHPGVTKDRMIGLTVDAAIDRRVSLVGDAASYIDLLKKLGVPDWVAGDVLTGLRERVAHYMAEGIRVDDPTNNPDHLTAEDTLWLVQQARFFAKRPPIKGEPDYKNYLEGEVRVIEPSKSEDEAAQKPDVSAQSAITATQIAEGEPKKAGDLIEDADLSRSQDADEGPVPHGDGPKPRPGSHIPFTGDEIAGRSSSPSEDADVRSGSESQEGGQKEQIPLGDARRPIDLAEVGTRSDLDALMAEQVRLANGNGRDVLVRVPEGASLSNIDHSLMARVGEAGINLQDAEGRNRIQFFKSETSEEGDRLVVFRIPSDQNKADQQPGHILTAWGVRKVQNGEIPDAEDYVDYKFQGSVIAGEGKEGPAVSSSQGRDREQSAEDDRIIEEERVIKEILSEVGYFRPEGESNDEDRSKISAADIYKHLSAEAQEEIRSQIERRDLKHAPDSPVMVGALIGRMIASVGTKPENLGEVYYAVGQEVFDRMLTLIKDPEDRAKAQKARADFIKAREGNDRAETEPPSVVPAPEASSSKPEPLAADAESGDANKEDSDPNAVGVSEGQPPPSPPPVLDRLEEAQRQIEEQREQVLRIGVDRLLNRFFLSDPGRRGDLLQTVAGALYNLNPSVDLVYDRIREAQFVDLDDKRQILTEFSTILLDRGTPEQLKKASENPGFSTWREDMVKMRAENVAVAKIISEKGIQDQGDRNQVIACLLEGRATSGEVNDVLANLDKKDANIVKTKFYEAIKKGDSRMTYIQDWRNNEDYKKWDRTLKDRGRDVFKSIGRRVLGKSRVVRPQTLPTGNEPRADEKTAFAPVLPADANPPEVRIAEPISMSLEQMGVTAKEVGREISRVLAKISEGEFGEKSGKNLMGYLEGLTEVDKAVDYSEISKEIEDALDSTPSVTPRAAISDAALIKLNELIQGGDGRKAISFIDVLTKTSLGARGIAGIEEDRLKALREALERGDI